MENPSHHQPSGRSRGYRPAFTTPLESELQMAKQTAEAEMTIPPNFNEVNPNEQEAKGREMTPLQIRHTKISREIAIAQENVDKNLLEFKRLSFDKAYYQTQTTDFSETEQ